ncbi:MAG: aldo/keto reductase, partial [Candidatus Thermoplasmatota archaeon]|nr:aldo/keto reductase [Candidatus Thermoplasmatota archaeon]
MEHVQLGTTGTRVSRICLGTMGFGSKQWRPWVVEEDEALPILERALDLGINFWDTADMYSQGESERIVGQALEGRRDEVVLATKVYHPMGEDPNARGLSRKHIRDAVLASLERLDTGYIDLYQVHRHDADTPLMETLTTLSDLVDDGLVNYLGASTMWAHQFVRAHTLQQERGLHAYVTMQNHWNLLYREEEREMVPYCREQGVGLIPWSPLARGELAHAGAPRETTRAESDAGTPFYAGQAAEEIKQRVAQLSEDKGVQPAQLSLAWLLHQEGVTAPIVGVTKISHLEAAAEAVDLRLTDKDLAWLEEAYQPQAVRGWLRG